jgi:hypothetical protein
VLDYCIGEVGLRPDEFWSMTLEEVSLACRGYEVRIAREKELERYIATLILSFGGSKHTPQEVWPLITDKENKTKLITKEENDKMNEFFSKVKWQSND